MNTSNITNYKPKDFAELLGVSVKTLQRWDREGTLKANWTPTNRRYYTYDQYFQFKGVNIENDNRKKWNELLDKVMEQKIKTIIIAHKDRFVRFGYDWFEKFCMKFNTTIVVVNNEELSPQEELVQEIVSILHIFSCRLYGFRKYKKQIERDTEIAKEFQNRNQSNRGAKNQDW